MKSVNVHVFTVETVLVRAIVRDNYVEYNLYPPNDNWMRFFVSTVGFNGSNDELEQVGRDVVMKRVFNVA